MKAWRLQRLGGDLSLQDIPVPEPRAGSVLIRMHAAALVSYLRNYVQGKLPGFMYPPDAYRRLLGLLRSGMLDISVLRPLEYSLPDLPAAMDAAAIATNFECVVVKV